MSGDKTIIFKIILGLVLILFCLRLFYLQIYNSEYSTLSEENIVHLETIYPSRGIIYDRNDSILVENRPSYDFYIIPRKFSVKDTASLLNSFSIKKYQLEQIIKKAANYSRYRPSIFYKDMSHKRFAQIQSDLYHFNGIYHVSKPTRYYPFKTLSHDEYIVEKNTRLLQICAPTLEPVHVEFAASEGELGTTNRGEGGFGSTGTNETHYTQHNTPFHFPSSPLFQQSLGEFQNLMTQLDSQISSQMGVFGDQFNLNQYQPPSSPSPPATPPDPSPEDDEFNPDVGDVD